MQVETPAVFVINHLFSATLQVIKWTFEPNKNQSGR